MMPNYPFTGTGNPDAYTERISMTEVDRMMRKDSRMMQEVCKNESGGRA